MQLGGIRNDVNANNIYLKSSKTIQLLSLDRKLKNKKFNNDSKTIMNKKNDSTKIKKFKAKLKLQKMFITKK
jgi:hypothetical protein